VRRAAKEFDPSLRFSSRNCETHGDGSFRLSRSLPRSAFNRPIMESYNDHEAYMTYCFRSAPSVEQVRGVIVRLAGRFEGGPSEPEEFPQERNRLRVRLHLVRERSSVQADTVKRKAKFTCQVCRFNFGEEYGELGQAYAEAHHVVPLSKLREGTKIREKDFKVVCANCHRMLHRMGGERTDPATLKRLLRHGRR